MLKTTPELKIHYTLRIASAMCFFGHGAFGIIGKPIWSNYFAVFGIGHDLSFQIMPFVGFIDILMGIIILLYPLRAVIIWLIIWGFITALLRPLSGEPFPEFIERAGNFGAPLALLLFSKGMKTNFKNLFTPFRPNIHLDEKILARVITCLRIIVFLLFVGHGWLNIMEKKSLVDQYRALGFLDPGEIAQVIGIFEIIGGILVLIRPLKSVVLFLFIWKITSELLYPHYTLFEWIERGGSYGVVLALWYSLNMIPTIRGNNVSSNSNTLFLNQSLLP
ncbi:MAG: hypothetical protein M3Z26_17855 [Bacteroidota bacterium]|nr:hypothetical protein [Bacteroidota bacterium]